jgi:hypothetical protein
MFANPHGDSTRIGLHVEKSEKVITYINSSGSYIGLSFSFLS